MFKKISIAMLLTATLYAMVQTMNDPHPKFYNFADLYPNANQMCQDQDLHFSDETIRYVKFSDEKDPIIATFYNTSGLDLYMRLRSGEDEKISILRPNVNNSKFDLPGNYETFLVPKWAYFSLDVSDIEYPLRIRTWPTSYKPTMDIDYYGNPVETSKQNAENSLTASKWSKNEFSEGDNVIYLVQANPPNKLDEGDYVITRDRRYSIKTISGDSYNAVSHFDDITKRPKSIFLGKLQRTGYDKW